ncbi:MAG: BTAD domain-containing putative transcriptional regulator, partial [Chloroflexota bacterium]
MPDATAEANLRLSLSRIRKSLAPAPDGDSLLSITPESIQFNSNAACWLDAAAMAALIGECETHSHRSMTACQPCLERLRQAVELYRGEFLSGFFLEDCPEFEQWVLTKREEFDRRVLEALDCLAEYHERRGEFDPARRYAERELALSRWSESAHRRLMRAYALSGRRDLALTQYDSCRRILEKELGVEPDESTTALYKQIQGGQLRPSRLTFLNNLPAPLTSFIGRKTELTRLGNLLANPACRLVTLIGPGGVGKTRLALQAAANLADGFEHGAYFIPLASLRDANLVPQAFAQALNLKEEPNRPLIETVKEHLRERQLLLVVDNFEQILDAAPLVTEILRECPQVAAIATSREALRVYGEVEFAVPPLDTPDLKHPPDAETLRQYSAPELFLERALAVQPHFTLVNGAAAEIAEVCARLDGIPLAIELAAARCRELSPGQILDQLRDA